MFSYLLLGCWLSCCVRNLNIHGKIITILDQQFNAESKHSWNVYHDQQFNADHGMIITILDQQFNEVSVPIVIVTILLKSRDELSPANTGVFPVVSASPLRSVFFGSLLQAFRYMECGGANSESRRKEGEGDFREPWLIFLPMFFAHSPQSERRGQSIFFCFFQAERSILYSFLQILCLNWSARKRSFFIVLY